jgi:hypothetical protein
MGFIIVCQEPAIFNLIFPQVENYIGGFDFGFSNGGELIRLFNSDGTLVDYVDYDDNTPWPEMPDGGGATLELKSMPRDNYHFSNWKESPGFGTPGQINSVTLNTNNANNINPNQYFILNYPNPFNPNTTIRYQLPVQSNVSIIIYDITGKEIRHLVNDVQDAGFNSVVWNATNDLSQPVSAGIYLYRIAAEDFQQVKKMVFLK